MTSYRPIGFLDLLAFNCVNVDRFTETYSISFYSDYLCKWPEFQDVARHGPTGTANFSDGLSGGAATTKVVSPIARGTGGAGGNGVMMGYVLGKVEGREEDWHGHISAVTVGSTFRRLGLGERMMKVLEDVTETVHNGYFVDLFVRRSNDVARVMYEKLGYKLYRTVDGYYRGGLDNTVHARNEDALELRKPMRRDRQRSVSSVEPPSKKVWKPEELSFN